MKKVILALSFLASRAFGPLRVFRAGFLLAAALVSWSAHSASVEWNAFAVTDWDSWWPGLWTIDSSIGGMGINSNGDIVADGSIYSSGDFGSYWVYASAGDYLAGFGDYAALPLAADLAFTSDNAIGGENINAHRDSDGKLYLAIIAKEGQDSPKYHYGWVYLQDKTILSSALSDLPLYVGTGEVIPEPSSGVLLLLGVAGLALGRKRLNRGDAYMLCVHEMPSVPFSACVLISSHLIPANPGEVSSGLWYNCAQGILSTRNTRSAK